MRIARLKVVASTALPGEMSLRGPLGRGKNDPAHGHITDAGFIEGEDVVLISAADFEALAKVRTP